MSLKDQFEAACVTACNDRSIPGPHLTAIVRNILNDPRTARLLETLLPEQIENSAGTAVIWEAVFYFANGDGKSDQAAVDKVKAKIPPFSGSLF